MAKTRNIKTFLGTLLLFIIGLGLIAFGLLPLTGGDLPAGIGIVVFGGLFIVLGVWSRRQARWAFLLGLLLYIGGFAFKNSADIGMEDMGSLVFHAVIILTLVLAFVGTFQQKGNKNSTT